MRQAIIDVLIRVIDDPSFVDRSDRRWVYATLANCSWALGNKAEGDRYERCFLEEAPADWEIKTVIEGKAAVYGDTLSAS